MTTAKRRIWGWYFFDWASQPYNTLLLTFIFGPYITTVIGDGSEAQAVWGYGVAAAGVIIALFSPLLGAVADNARGRMPFIWAFSVMYVVGAWGLWFAHPETMNIWVVMGFFALGLIGMEFATNFTNALMPDLAPASELGRISGSGWAFGYLGGVLALVIMLVLFDDSSAGKTLIGADPVLGLDSTQREGTRAVGPLTAIWYVLFMVPFFLWVKEPKREGMPVMQAARQAMPDLAATLRTLPARRSLSAYLLSSMFYRDALNGMYTFGGIYAAGMLGWAPVQMGVFGILAALTGALFAWIGGRADSRFGPKPVIRWCLIVLTLVAIGIVMVSRDSVLGIPVDADSKLPDVAFYILGAMIGAAGGALQSSSRTMMIRQADPDRMTEAFGLFALTGKATSFLAPLAIALTTDISGSQRIGISPLIVLFLIGLFLLRWVKPNGDPQAGR
jgi:MFS transporter, UMF1 family